MGESLSVKQQEINPRGVWNGAHLKWIASISMLVDHLAAGGLVAEGTAFYVLCRAVGRLAFPLFAFLLVQGYQHTSNRMRYIRRLFVFAFVSEIPFNLAFYGSWLAPSHQNIFFTLGLGLGGYALFDRWNDRSQHGKKIIALLLPPLLALFSGVDYGTYGIVVIYCLLHFRDARLIQTISGLMLMAITHIAGMIAFIPIWLYNGQRGSQSKGFFYLFYPGHLLAIYLLRISFF